MRILTLLFSFALITHCSFAQRNIDVTRYSYSIDLSDQNDTIRGMARIYFTARQPLTSIELDLSGLNSSKKGMIVTDVVYDPFSSRMLSHNHANDKLKIMLGE